MRLALVIGVLLSTFGSGAHTPTPTPEPVPVTAADYPKCDTPEDWQHNGWCQVPGVFLRLTF